jgi:hypothetical protein
MEGEGGFFEVVDLRRVRVRGAPRVSIAPRRDPREGELREFFRELGFHTGGATVASKVYEKVVGSSVHRLYIEVYNAEGYFTAVFALSTRDVEELKQVARLLNALLEREAASRGYERVV